MYQGYFINLARSESRRRVLVHHLEALGAAERYQRFEAIEGRAVAAQYPSPLDAGALGLWLTHLMLLEACRGTPLHLHIIEDDVLLIQNPLPQFEQMLARIDGQLSDWDLLYTDIHINTGDIEMFRLLHRAVRTFEQTQKHTIYDLQPLPFCSASSVFINRRSLDKYLALLADGWKGTLPIDLFVRSLVNRGLLKAYAIVPFMTSFSREADQSTIKNDIDGFQGLTHAVSTAYRRAFFQEADVGAIDAEICELTKVIAAPSRLTELYRKVLLYRLSDEWVQY